VLFLVSVIHQILRLDVQQARRQCHKELSLVLPLLSFSFISSTEEWRQYVFIWTWSTKPLWVVILGHINTKSSAFADDFDSFL
jgi:hypothetical protein